MLKYLFMIIGGLIFIGGYYFVKKNRGAVGPMRFYGLVSYAGLSVFILCGARVLDPLFVKMGSQGSTIELAIQAAGFVIGAELLLKPVFEDMQEKKTSKKITSRGSVSDRKTTYTASKKHKKK